jgi:uncharacterized protein (UPF0248 family)
MPNIRNILNKIKWTKGFNNVEIWYIHRGAVNNTKKIVGQEIITIGRSFLETTTATIPYHRITKIFYKNEIVFDRLSLLNKDKQL